MKCTEHICLCTDLHRVLYSGGNFGNSKSIPGRSKCDLHPERLAGALGRNEIGLPLSLHGAEGPRSQSGDENERECAGFLDLRMLLNILERSSARCHCWTTQGHYGSLA